MDWYKAISTIKIGRGHDDRKSSPIANKTISNRTKFQQFQNTTKVHIYDKPLIISLFDDKVRFPKSCPIIIIYLSLLVTTYYISKLLIGLLS